MNKNSISTARINKKDKIFFIRAFFILFVTSCFPDIYGLQGQELYFSKLSDKVPIPASETYNVIQDKQGYIWFATEEGFCRYSNNNLKVYDAQEGLPEKAVYASAIAPDGKLWVATRNRRILFFDGKKFVEAPFSKDYVRKTLTKAGWGYPLKLIFHENKLIVPDQLCETVIDLKTGEVKLYPELKKDGRIIQVGNQVFFNNRSLRGSYRNILFPGRKIKIELNGANLYDAPVTLLAGSRILVSRLNCFWEVKENDEVDLHCLDDRILTMTSDEEGNTWIGLQNKGLYLFRRGDLNGTPVVSLRGLSISGIFRDHNGGIWCTTLEKGVYYCQNINTLSYTNVGELSGRISILHAIPGVGVLALKNGSKDALLLSDTDVKLYAEIIPSNTYFGISKVAEGIWIGASPNSMVINRKTLKVQQITGNRSVGYGALGNKQHRILFSYSFIREFIDGKHFRDIHAYGEGRLKNFTAIDGNRYMLYGKKLLLIYNSGNHHVTKLSLPSEEISCVAPVNKNEVIIGTRDKGLFIYDLKTNHFRKLEIGIPTTIVLSALRDRQGCFWIGTNEGVFFYNPVSEKTTWISQKYGLSLTETRQLTESGNYIYFGTNDGVFSLNATEMANQSTIYCPVVSLKTNGSTAAISADITFFEKGAAFYYRIDGAGQTELTKMTSRSEKLANLSPGDYTFYGFVQAVDGSRSPVVKLGFYIAPTVVQTLWFRGLILVLCLLLIWLVIRWRIRIVRRREEEKTRINTQLAEFQMSALQAQMNPHFIFNAINTIQSYILTRNKEDAYRYLTKFSNLIRLVLHNSQEKFIPLVEELEVINTYLELEQARFSNFTYRVDVHPDIDIYETMVPAMLVQPYLENAVWHGLGHLTERPGQLTLTFRISEDCLQIEIRDNGIGRQAASKNKRSTHKSVGTSITQQRLETLAQLNEGGIATVEVIDLYENNIATGTLIVIKVSLPDNS